MQRDDVARPSEWQLDETTLLVSDVQELSGWSAGLPHGGIDTGYTIPISYTPTGWLELAQLLGDSVLGRFARRVPWYGGSVRSRRELRDIVARVEALARTRVSAFAQIAAAVQVWDSPSGGTTGRWDTMAYVPNPSSGMVVGYALHAYQGQQVRVLSLFGPLPSGQKGHAGELIGQWPNYVDCGRDCYHRQGHE